MSKCLKKSINKCSMVNPWAKPKLQAQKSTKGLYGERDKTSFNAITSALMFSCVLYCKTN